MARLDNLPRVAGDVAGEAFALNRSDLEESQIGRLHDCLCFLTTPATRLEVSMAKFGSQLIAMDTIESHRAAPSRRVGRAGARNNGPWAGRANC